MLVPRENVVREACLVQRVNKAHPGGKDRQELWDIRAPRDNKVA